MIIDFRNEELEVRGERKAFALKYEIFRILVLSLM